MLPWVRLSPGLLFAPFAWKRKWKSLPIRTHTGNAMGRCELRHEVRVDPPDAPRDFYRVSHSPMKARQRAVFARGIGAGLSGREERAPGDPSPPPVSRQGAVHEVVVDLHGDEVSTNGHRTSAQSPREGQGLSVGAEMDEGTAAQACSIILDLRRTEAVFREVSACRGRAKRAAACS